MSTLWMVAYDISDDRIRSRVSEILLDNGGERVQYSVFECRLNGDGFERLRGLLNTEIEGDDSVRWYPLCSWCKKEIIIQGEGSFTGEEDYFLL